MNMFVLLWKKWLTIAKIIGNFQAQVIFSFFYLILFCPFGIIFSYFKDELKIKRSNKKPLTTNFGSWMHKPEKLVEAKRQY